MAYRSVFKPGLFDGQTVIVTGGGSGIGRCTAHEIAALGAHVVITGRKPDKLATVRGEIEAAGGTCEVIPGPKKPVRNKMGQGKNSKKPKPVEAPK